MRNFVRKLSADRNGATAIEYGLIAAIIALGIITGLGSVKTNLATKFTAVGTAISTAQ